ncbi:MAG: coiled-coil domain-containing protein, partial [Actinomycetota bacterium]
MTNRLKRFPASFRFVAVTFALVATASLATSAAAGPPSAEQVQNAKDRVAQLVRDAHVAQRQLDAINIRANEVAAEYDRELGRLEKLNAELLHTQLTLAQARARYDAIVAQLNERARTMFMQGPASDLEFLLGASSFSDLTDRLEYV